MTPPDTDNHSVAQISRESGSHTLLGMTPKQYEQQLLNKDVTYLGV